jgi:PAS domain S-box-containing protein
LHDLEGRIIQANDEALKVFGYSKPELLRLNINDLLLENSPDCAQENIDLTLNNGCRKKEVIFKKKNGDRCFAYAYFNLLEIENRKLIQCVAFDINEIKRRKERMLVRDRAMQTVSNGIFITDATQPHNPIVHCNPAFEEMTGYSRSEIIGLNCEFLLNDSDNKEALRDVQSAIKERRVWTGIVKKYGGDGRIIWYELTVSPVNEVTGELTNFVGVMDDITVRILGEESLKKARDELQVRVEERTRELLLLSESLKAEIIERKKADHYLQKAFAEIEKLKDQLEAEKSYLQEEFDLEYSHGDSMGHSKAIREVMRQVEHVADSDSTVLLVGETGTGKELLAHAVHNLSKRRDRVMVKMNCAALPANLIESELFGYERGAFSGADKRKIGRFEVADGSTIFLDEIGELPVEIQPKLLRVLEEGTFYRLGSEKDIKVDVRIIAATNRDLEEAINKGLFRQDLYYRLSVFPIKVPPLRKRKEDIPLIARALLKEIGDRMGRKIEEIPTATIKSLQSYDWPGNVRELRNLIERAMILNRGTRFQPQLPGVTDSSALGRTKLDDFEKQHIIEVLEANRRRIRGRGGAAEILGLKPTTLESRMKKLGIQKSRADE